MLIWLTSAKRSGRKLRLDRASRIETVSPVFWQRSSLWNKSEVTWNWKPTLYNQYFAKVAHIIDYYSFKIFPRFWLVKTGPIIHHNQLLFTKFGKNLRHIESMTSKMQPAANYWTDDVKSAARYRLLNLWPRKPGDKVALHLVSGKTKSEMAKLL